MFYLHSLNHQNNKIDLVNMAIKILKYQLNLQPRRNKKLLAKFYSGTKCLFRTIKFYSSFTISRSNTLGIIDCYIPGSYFLSQKTWLSYLYKLYELWLGQPYGYTYSLNISLRDIDHNLLVIFHNRTPFN